MHTPPPEPPHIIQAREYALENGLDPDVVSATLDIAAYYYRERYNGPHKVMTEAKLAAHEVLYKYRNADDKHHWEILENQEIYFANPSSFNDPFDSNIYMRYDLLPQEEIDKRVEEAAFAIHPTGGYHLIQGEIKRIKEGMLTPERHDEAVRKWMNNWVSKMRVFCICPERDNILLWSHYSYNHTGFAVGFDPIKLYNLCNANGGYQTGYVAYKEEYPILLPPKGDDRKAQGEIMTNVMNVKSSVWEYEQEIRMTMFDGPQKALFESDLIKEIVIGCKMAPKYQERLLRVATEKYPHASVYRAKLSRGEFALDFDKLIG
jgi:Protein of unknown function (DUF2971)